jgi:hypothetical protein
MGKLAVGSAAFLAAMAAATLAHAGTGYFWENGYPDNSSADLAAVASAGGTGSATGTFSFGNINFNSFGSNGYTVGGFLASGGVTVSDANTVDNTLFEFDGSITVHTGEVIEVVHDDGASLYISGSLVPGLNPGPTAAVTEFAKYTGPTGTFSFQLVYGESNGPPAVLAAFIPEPSTWAMMLLGFAGLGFAGYRKAKSVALVA